MATTRSGIVADSKPTRRKWLCDSNTTRRTKLFHKLIDKAFNFNPAVVVTLANAHCANALARFQAVKGTPFNV